MTTGRAAGFSHPFPTRRTTLRAGAVGILGLGLAQSSVGRPEPADEKPAAKVVHIENLVYGQIHGAGLLADVAYPESKERLPAILSVQDRKSTRLNSSHL